MKSTFTYKLFLSFLGLTAFLFEVHNASAQCTGGQTTVNFSALAAVQSWIVPTGVTSIDIYVTGADGGNHNGAQNGGSRATASGTFTVTPGETIEVVAAIKGQSGGSVLGKGGGGGGGGSGVRKATGSVILVVAGGGGGGGFNTGGSGGTIAAGGGGGGAGGSHAGSKSETGSSGAGDGGINTGGGSRNGGGGSGPGGGSPGGGGGGGGFGANGGAGSVGGGHESIAGGYGAGGGGGSGSDDGNNTKGGAGGGGGGYSGGGGGNALGWHTGGTLGGSGGGSYVNPIGTNPSLTAGTTGSGSESDGFVVICYSLALPVELIDFRAYHYETSEVGLSWQTASESNNAGFAIEHSTTGTAWEQIGFIPGKGTTTLEQSYSFMHRTPSLGINYYRLKQTDFDGHFDYSKVVGAEVGGDTNGMYFTPNPGAESSAVILHILIENFEYGQLEIFDVNGKVVLSRKIDKESIPLEISHLSKGIYYTLVTFDRMRLVERLIVN